MLDSHVCLVCIYPRSPMLQFTSCFLISTESRPRFLGGPVCFFWSAPEFDCAFTPLQPNQTSKANKYWVWLKRATQGWWCGCNLILSWFFEAIPYMGSNLGALYSRGWIQMHTTLLIFVKQPNQTCIASHIYIKRCAPCALACMRGHCFKSTGCNKWNTLHCRETFCHHLAWQ